MGKWDSDGCVHRKTGFFRFRSDEDVEIQESESGGAGVQSGVPCWPLTSRIKVVFPDLMKTANVADLRNDFRKIAGWIADGESVSIKMRGKLFALLSPIRGEDGPPMPAIDFGAQLKRIWGERVFTDDEVRRMRDAELEGQEG